MADQTVKQRCSEGLHVHFLLLRAQILLRHLLLASTIMRPNSSSRRACSGGSDSKSCCLHPEAPAGQYCLFRQQSDPGPATLHALSSVLSTVPHCQLAGVAIPAAAAVAVAVAAVAALTSCAAAGRGAVQCLQASVQGAGHLLVRDQRDQVFKVSGQQQDVVDLRALPSSVIHTLCKAVMQCSRPDPLACACLSAQRGNHHRKT
jgi:hypothetical protein